MMDRSEAIALDRSNDRTLAGEPCPFCAQHVGHTRECAYMAGWFIGKVPLREIRPGCLSVRFLTMADRIRGRG